MTNIYSLCGRFHAMRVLRYKLYYYTITYFRENKDIGRLWFLGDPTPVTPSQVKACQPISLHNGLVKYFI